MNIVITGGGTGGHVNPGLAVANTIREKDPEAQISFVGTSRGIENKLVPKAGYPLYHVEITGLRRSLSLSNIKTLYLTVTSVFKAKKLLKRLEPDAVFATGGYVCYPVVKAAHQMGIPVFLHESNAIPGVAIRMLEKYAQTVFVNFEECIKHLKEPNKAIRVGNPMLASGLPVTGETERKNLGVGSQYQHFLLSFGGSMGAEQVNFAILRLMRDYTSKHPEILHIHATGSIEYEIAKKKFYDYNLEQYPNLQLLEYIYDMPQKMAAADLVICRAGSMTLSELAILSKPCILIPSPNVTNNHQFKNADVLRCAGAAILIEEKELADGSLTAKAQEILDNPRQLRKMANEIQKFAITDANEQIYQNIVKAIH